MEPFFPPLRKSYYFRAGQHTLHLGQTTRLMGILNLTPDSFSQDGCFKDGIHDPQRNLDQALRLIEEGADILDVGAESTRPGARPVSVKEELHRLVPTLKLLSRKTKIPISVDTYKPKVAQKALELGASIINNIMGTTPDRTLLKMVRDHQAGIILMHIRGKPQTMQRAPRYRNLMEEIIRELQKSLEICLEIGIKSDRIVIDPGIGFGKTLQHNLEILRQLGELRRLDRPVLLGTSRKSFIGKILNRDFKDRLCGTVATIVVGIFNGAHFVRVHDVACSRDAARMADAILQLPNSNRAPHSL